VPPDNVQVRTGAWIGAGWEFVKADVVNLALMALVYALVANAAMGLLTGALSCGFFVVFMKKVLGQRTEFGDLFKGFSFFVPALVASIITGIFIIIGSLLCIIPGLVVAAMYMFVYLFIVDRKMDFWPAMQASHAIVKKDYLGFTLFLLAMVAINILGVLACFVGVFITMPIQFAAITVAYKEIAGFASDPSTI
jgi:uncharacterized membrane protein